MRVSFQLVVGESSWTGNLDVVAIHWLFHDEGWARWVSRKLSVSNRNRLGDAIVEGLAANPPTPSFQVELAEAGWGTDRLNWEELSTHLYNHIRKPNKSNYMYCFLLED